SWTVTDQCNYQCAYCDSWELEKKELTTAEALNLVDEMAALGVLKLSLSGGEPLLRPDMGPILDAVRRRGIRFSLNTNGSLFVRKWPILRGVSTVVFSLDGPPEVHDRIRGPGSFEAIAEATDLARSNGVKVLYTTVISAESLGSVDWMLDHAKARRVPVTFQPATEDKLRKTARNPISPEPGAYRAAIDRVLAAKKSNAYIANSAEGLRFLRRWPEPAPMPCGGYVFCRVKSDGEVAVCGRVDHGDLRPNVREGGLSAAFAKLPVPTCDDCWCAPRVEFNKAFRLAPSAVWNLASFL
ncbi:MAG: radical SAM protein, partial [Candidatus Methylomirabilis sp.]|nr:radical SAM protein [Deltaproteobacteria bacterium]